MKLNNCDIFVGMADEFIDITDRNGRATGETRLKSEAHKLGLYHSSVHIWFYTKSKEVLIQKRSDNKDTYPGLWDISVAGHIGAGENPVYAALREIEEEIGLTITETQLSFIGNYWAQKTPKPNIYDNEFHHIYLCNLEIKIEKLKLQTEEVSNIKLIALKTFQEEVFDIKKQQKYVPHDEEYYNFIIENIEKRFFKK